MKLINYAKERYKSLVKYKNLILAGNFNKAKGIYNREINPFKDSKFYVDAKELGLMKNVKIKFDKKFL